jgi:hypothetical protein
MKKKKTESESIENPFLAFAAQSVRELAKAQGGAISARDAHEAWRWSLVSRGWKAGDLDPAGKTHPLLVAFDTLPIADTGHALAFLEGVDVAEQNTGNRIDAADLGQPAR